MSTVLDGRKKCLDGKSLQIAAGADFDELPNVSVLMAGKIGKDQKTWESPPHSLILWLEGTLLKFCFRSDDDAPKLYGSTSGLPGGLAGIEQALKQENCDWRHPRSSKKS